MLLGGRGSGKNPLAKALTEFGKAARMLVLKSTLKSDEAKERKGSVATNYRTSAVEFLKKKERRAAIATPPPQVHVYILINNKTSRAPP